MRTQPNTSLGISLNVIASFLFAYMSLLQSLTGNEVYGWRIFLTFPCLTLFIILQGNWLQVITIYQRIFKEHYFFLTR